MRPVRTARISGAESAVAVAAAMPRGKSLARRSGDTNAAPPITVAIRATQTPL
jgi:hypothetical protein